MLYSNSSALSIGYLDLLLPGFEAATRMIYIFVLIHWIALIGLYIEVTGSSFIMLASCQKIYFTFPVGVLGHTLNLMSKCWFSPNWVSSTSSIDLPLDLTDFIFITFFVLHDLMSTSGITCWIFNSALCYLFVHLPDVCWWFLLAFNLSGSIYF